MRPQESLARYGLKAPHPPYRGFRTCSLKSSKPRHAFSVHTTRVIRTRIASVASLWGSRVAPSRSSSRPNVVSLGVKVTHPPFHVGVPAPNGAGQHLTLHDTPRPSSEERPAFVRLQALVWGVRVPANTAQCGEGRFRRASELAPITQGKLLMHPASSSCTGGVARRLPRSLIEALSQHDAAGGGSLHALRVLSRSRLAVCVYAMLLAPKVVFFLWVIALVTRVLTGPEKKPGPRRMRPDIRHFLECHGSISTLHHPSPRGASAQDLSHATHTRLEKDTKKRHQKKRTQQT